MTENENISDAVEHLIEEFMKVAIENKVEYESLLEALAHKIDNAPTYKEFVGCNPITCAKNCCSE